ncbi:MAG: UvrD-helicase domain-containing protein [Tannerella sp.]|nr:UvrD-helicase domain-containing protein [Tannerella sp.]
MLTIYSASAGTGKTHTLTGEYMTLLFRGKDTYKHILAVTFTNKATAEMKSRIIEQLFRLADGQPSDFLSLLRESTGYDEMTIRKYARDILILILHDYTSFNISTIDHFFQHTVRAFTREVGLQGNYQIELDIDRMMDEAIDSMLSGLENKTDLMAWLLRFTEDNIEKGRGWKINNEIKKLGNELFKESFKIYGDDIGKEIRQKDLLSDYLDQLYGIIHSTESALKAIGEKGLALMRKHGLTPTDFKGKSRSPLTYFEKYAAGEMKEPTDTFRNLVDNIDGYCNSLTPANISASIKQAYAEGLNELVNSVIIFLDNLTNYYTAKEIIGNIYSLGILTDLSEHIAKWRDENNKFPISDTTELLNRIIDGSDVPFVYEKIGMRIENYMIDEFQDTSAMQWSNFRPLLKDSLDSGRANLIVGDVKQSIYRFRNSDWSLLDRRVKIDFDGLVRELNLEVNWRSHRNIVEFNNMFFRASADLLQNIFNAGIDESSLPEEEKEGYKSLIVSAYANVEQRVADMFAAKEGHVRIQFLADDEQSWEEKSMEQLPLIVERLQENGYELRDIAILTRKGREGAYAAEILLKYKETHPESKYKYDIITEDSLTVSSSFSVRWIMEMLKYICQPDDESKLYFAQLAYAMMLRKKNSTSASDDYSVDINNYLNDFPAHATDRLRQMSNRSLYELVEELFRLFINDIPANELIFVQTFLDIATEFSQNESADTVRFIEWWETEGSKKKIITPDSQNAIRIMTIHKSKGLGFKAVILPFADWEIDQRDAILWCHPSQKPFDRLSLVPIKYSKTLQKTIFAADYFHEKLQAYIDNLNIMYVACTRAKEELVVFAPQPKNEKPTVSSLLFNVVTADSDYPFNTETAVYERGAWWATKPVNNLGATEELPAHCFYSVSPDDRIRLRLHANGGYINDDRRRRGLLMHDILSRIETRNDIATAVSEKVFSGEIDAAEGEELKSKLMEATEREPIKKWFDGSAKVLKEAEILFGSGQSRRPDRIMIDSEGKATVVDYKFGQKETFHARQIGKYVSLLHEMGYQSVDGYIWYVNLNELERCNHTSKFNY